MQQKHKVDNSEPDLIYSLSPPFDIPPTSASTDLDSMFLGPSSLPHSRSISSDSMPELVQRAHPSLDLYKSNQTAGPLQRSEQSTLQLSPPFDISPTSASTDLDSIFPRPSSLLHEPDLIYSLSPPFDISPTSASTDLDSMFPRPYSLLRSTSICSDSTLKSVQRAHPSLDLYKSNQTAGPLQCSEQFTPRFSVAPTTRRPMCSIQEETKLSWHSVAIDGLRGLGANPDTGLMTNTHYIHSLESSHKPNLGAGESTFQRHDLPNTGAGESSDDGEQAEVRVVPMPTDCKLDSSVVRRETMIRKRKSTSMIQGKEITISDSKLTNVGRDYHEHNITYVIEEASTCRGCLDTISDMLKKVDDKLNVLLNSSPKEDSTKSDDGDYTFTFASRKRKYGRYE